MGATERVADALSVWFEKQARKLESAIYTTDDPDEAELLLGIEGDRDKKKVLKATKSVGKIEQCLGELTRRREEALSQLKKAKRRAKRLIAQGKDTTDPELATKLKIAATFEHTVQILTQEVETALQQKELTLAYVQALEFAREVAEARDLATISLMSANEVGELVVGYMTDVAKLNVRGSTSIRANLEKAVVQSRDRIRGEQEALGLVLELRGEEALTSQTYLTEEEEAIFASLQREVAPDSAEASEAAAEAQAS